LVIEGTQIHLVFGQENRWKHGNPLLELFMRKEAYSFVNFGTLEECRTMVFFFFKETMVSGFSNTQKINSLCYSFLCIKNNTGSKKYFTSSIRF